MRLAQLLLTGRVEVDKQLCSDGGLLQVLQGRRGSESERAQLWKWLSEPCQKAEGMVDVVDTNPGKLAGCRRHRAWLLVLRDGLRYSIQTKFYDGPELLVERDGRRVCVLDFVQEKRRTKKRSRGAVVDGG